MSSNPVLLGRLSRAAYPTQVVALSVDVDWVPDHAAPRRCRAVLRRWSAQGTEGRRGEYRRPAACEGTTADSFWSCLAGRLRRGGAVWVVCWRPAEAWGALGLWARLEGGLCRLVGHDERGQRAKRRPPGAPPPGRCILEGPPWVVDFRCPPAAGSVRALGAENWALGTGAGSEPGPGAAGALMGALLSMIGALRRRGWGGLCATAASQSLTAYRSAHATHHVLCHRDGVAGRLERDCYHGGRCEPFRLGAVPCPVYHYDVSSMYASLCLSETLPAVLVGHGTDVRVADLIDLAESYCVLAEVEAELVEPTLPVVLDRPRRVLYPVGRVRAAAPWPELAGLAASGRLHRCLRAAWYRPAPWLSAWAAALREERSLTAADSPLQGWLKRLGCALVGKLGQSERWWEPAEWRRPPGPWAVWTHRRAPWVRDRYRTLAGAVQREHAGGWAHLAVPSAAAWITSLGRALLWRLVTTAGRANVYYVDTDSLFVSAEGAARLEAAGEVRPGEWGKLRQVATYERLLVHAPKQYEADGQVTAAGRPGESACGPLGPDTVWVHPGVGAALAGRRRPEPTAVVVPWCREAVCRCGTRLEDGRVAPYLWEDW